MSEVSAKIQKKISSYLYRLEFVDRKLLNSSISDKKYIVQNCLNIDSLSIFHGWVKYNNSLVFFCKHNFSCIYYDNNEAKSINGYAQSSHFVYDMKDTLSIFIQDLQVVIIVSGKRRPEIQCQEFVNTDLQQLHFYYNKTRKA